MDGWMEDGAQCTACCCALLPGHGNGFRRDAIVLTRLRPGGEAHRLVHSPARGVPCCGATDDERSPNVAKKIKRAKLNYLEFVC